MIANHGPQLQPHHQVAAAGLRQADADGLEVEAAGVITPRPQLLEDRPQQVRPEGGRAGWPQQVRAELSKAPGRSAAGLGAAAAI